jgi:hypothetical protein
VSRERSLAEIYHRVPIRKGKIARYDYRFVDVNDYYVPEVLVRLFNNPLTGGSGGQPPNERLHRTRRNRGSAVIQLRRAAPVNLGVRLYRITR